MVVIDKPPWVRHGSDSGANESIFSVSLSGSRLATGGGDYMVKIWDMHVMRQVSKELGADGSSSTGTGSAGRGGGRTGSMVAGRGHAQNGAGGRGRGNGNGSGNGNANTHSTVPLCVLSEHSAVVNVVRFSGDGERLASGADDNTCCVYALQPNGHTSSQLPSQVGSNTVILSGSSSGSNEVWRRVHTLRGHESNITDLAWSADDKYIATASLDTRIIIWDVGVGGTGSGRMVRELRGHENFVKGVAFDPIGRYDDDERH